jgi:drug/metabolite transporter (DMT)-like permease
LRLARPWAMAPGRTVASSAAVAFAVVSVIGGFPYLFIKIAVDGGMPPILLAWARISLAAVILIAISWRTGWGDLRGRWPWMVAYAVAEIAIPFPMLAAGETRTSSSTAAILVAMCPLVVAILALRFDPSERSNGRRLLGLGIGLAGVAALVGINVDLEGGEMLGVGAVLVATVGFAVGPMILKRHLAEMEPIPLMAIALGVAAVALAGLAAPTIASASPDAGALTATVVLGVVSTALLYVFFARLIALVGPGRALLVTYINPVIAVALGIAFLSEQPGPGAFVGLVAILVGSWLAAQGAFRVGASGLP